MSITTLESLKKKATIIRKFMQEKYDVNVSQGHSLELISKLSDFKDWNTASAALKPKMNGNYSPMQIMTVGDMKKALEEFEDSAIIEADYKFKLKEFEINLDDDPESEIYQEFSFTLEESAKDIIIIKLELVHESITF